MATISLMFGLLAIGLAISLGLYVVLNRRPAEAMLAESMAATTAAAASHGPDPNAVPAIFARMASLAAKLTPSDYLRRLQRRLDKAGNRPGWNVDRVQAYKGFGLVAGVIVGLLFGVTHGLLAAIGLPAVLATFFFFVPDILVGNFGQRRQLELQKGLPDALDMMTVGVEAGLGFDSAMARVARNLQGPVAEEFARVLQEMQFGLSRIEALRSLVERTDLPELRRFTSAIVQSSELGISIGAVLREQAHEMRVLRRQRAEERAQKLQVKILLPLILCLLPCIFIVILGPAALHLVDFFRGTKN